MIKTKMCELSLRMACTIICRWLIRSSSQRQSDECNHNYFCTFFFVVVVLLVFVVD